MNDKLKPGQAALRSRLSSNLKRIRATQNISQEKLGDLAGLHRTYISQVERMVTNVSLDNIYLLAEALSVDPADLLAIAGKEPEKEGETSPNEIGSTKKGGRRPLSKN